MIIRMIMTLMITMAAAEVTQDDAVLATDDGDDYSDYVLYHRKEMIEYYYDSSDGVSTTPSLLLTSRERVAGVTKDVQGAEYVTTSSTSSSTIPYKGDGKVTNNGPGPEHITTSSTSSSTVLHEGDGNVTNNSRGPEHVTTSSASSSTVLYKGDGNITNGTQGAERVSTTLLTSSSIKPDEGYGNVTNDSQGAEQVSTTSLTSSSAVLYEGDGNVTNGAQGAEQVSTSSISSSFVSYEDVGKVTNDAQGAEHVSTTSLTSSSLKLNESDGKVRNAGDNGGGASFSTSSPPVTSPDRSANTNSVETEDHGVKAGKESNVEPQNEVVTFSDDTSGNAGNNSKATDSPSGEVKTSGDGVDGVSTLAPPSPMTPSERVTNENNVNGILTSPSPSQLTTHERDNGVTHGGQNDADWVKPGDEVITFGDSPDAKYPDNSEDIDGLGGAPEGKPNNKENDSGGDNRKKNSGSGRVKPSRNKGTFVGKPKCPNYDYDSHVDADSEEESLQYDVGNLLCIEGSFFPFNIFCDDPKKEVTPRPRPANIPRKENLQDVLFKYFG